MMQSHRKPWTDTDDALLLRLYGKRKNVYIAKRLGRTVGGILNRTRDLRAEGRLLSAANLHWSEADFQRAVDMIDSGIGVVSAARRLRRSTRGLLQYLCDRRVGVCDRLRYADGMSIADVANELGIGQQAIGDHIRAGRLHATRQVVIRKVIYSISPIDVREFVAQYGGYVPMRPDTDWAPIVEASQQAFRTRYISRMALARAMHVCTDVLARLNRAGSLPPALRLSNVYGGVITSERRCGRGSKSIPRTSPRHRERS